MAKNKDNKTKKKLKTKKQANVNLEVAEELAPKKSKNK